MRVVLDTNVLLPAFFGSGLCHALLERMLESDTTTLVLSEHIIEEFLEWATTKFGASRRDVDDAVKLLRSAAEIVTPAKVESTMIADRDDLPVLGTATSAGADALVTGDRELLELGEIEGIPIITPRALFERL